MRMGGEVELCLVVPTFLSTLDTRGPNPTTPSLGVSVSQMLPGGTKPVVTCPSTSSISSVT